MLASKKETFKVTNPDIAVTGNKESIISPAPDNPNSVISSLDRSSVPRLSRPGYGPPASTSTDVSFTRAQLLAPCSAGERNLRRSGRLTRGRRRWASTQRLFCYSARERSMLPYRLSPLCTSAWVLLTFSRLESEVLGQVYVLIGGFCCGLRSRHWS